jgi:hypothetical protein
MASIGYAYRCSCRGTKPSQSHRHTASDSTTAKTPYSTHMYSRSGRPPYLTRYLSGIVLSKPVSFPKVSLAAPAVERGTVSPFGSARQQRHGGDPVLE